MTSPFHTLNQQLQNHIAHSEKLIERIDFQSLYAPNLNTSSEKTLKGHTRQTVTIIFKDCSCILKITNGSVFPPPTHAASWTNSSRLECRWFSSVKETSSTMKSGQEKPTGKFSFRASVEQEKSPWKGSWQQVTGYCGETGARDWLCVKWFRLARSLDLKKEASAMLMRLSPGWDDVRAVTAAWESMTHCKK